MDQWLNDAPTLAYVKELYIWVVLNNNGNLIAWTDDAAEADELSLWVLGYEKKVESGSRNCIEHRRSQAEPCFCKPTRWKASITTTEQGR